jgi:N-hydroxyarylamine O-acetyltransferase
MDVDAYLRRLGSTRPAGRSAADLATLHRAHLLTVPFEDLDIHRGVPIDLDLDAIYDKVVRRRRGGFCYENNGLFAGLLTELGFDVTLVSAFSLDDEGNRGPEFDLVSAGREELLVTFREP